MIALILLSVLACDRRTTATYFDGPYDAAILDAEDGPFTEPTGYVANTRSGRITPLDIKHGTLLSDQPAAPWLAPRFIATGDQRQLGPLAVWSDGEAVTVFVADVANGVLVQAPYVTEMDPDPVVVDPEASDPEFEDNDGSGDEASLRDLELRGGWTTTEDWSIEYDGSEWWVYGSRSGKQANTADFNVPYHTDNHELEFRISGSASSGDRFTLSTDTGVVEHDLGGQPLDVVLIEDLALIAVALWDGDAGQGWISLFDPAAAAEVGQVPLPAGAQPWQIVQAEGELFVADAQLPAVYAITPDAADPGASAVAVIETAAPVVDVAWVGEGDAGEDGAYRNLFVALAGLNRVDVYDLLAGAWRDVSPYDGRDGGLDVRSPIIGLSATPEPIGLQETTGYLHRVEKKAVAFTTIDGAFSLLEGDSGCQAWTLAGPTIAGDSGEAYDRTSSSLTLYTDDATSRAVTVPACGGLLFSEAWTVTYDGVTGDWEVEGSRSGVQASRAREEERYVSDTGAISFTILAGSLPPTDGDAFAFNTTSGALQIDSRADLNGNSVPFEIPAPPVVFQYDSGPTGGGWDPLRRKTYALVPVMNSNVVMRVRLESWSIEAVWD